MKYLIIFLLFCSVTFAQTARIKGVILNEFNEPVENVSVKAGDLGTTTDKTGFFVLEIPANKKLMIVFGMNVNSTTGSPVDRQDLKHANGLWARFESYRCGHVLGVAYVLSTPNSFDNWDVSQRYANQSNFDQQRAQAHQDGAKAVYELIKKAKLEGLV